MSTAKDLEANLKTSQSSSLVSGENYITASSSSPLTQDGHKQSHFQAFKDSFKKLEPVIDESELPPDATEAERNAFILQNTPLQKSLKTRHLRMIAIGGSIGTGLFVGSGSALATGGAASLPIAWTIVGTIVFCVIHALGELQCMYPQAGAFSAHATRFIEPSWGFAMGWNYVGLWIVVLPLEIIAASMTVTYWNDNINPVAWVTIFYIAIVSINLFGVKGYGEAEYLFSLIKLLAIVGFLILGIVLVCGGGPEGGFVGGRNYRDPGPFTNGFKGMCTVFVTATYSLGGTELIGLAAAEAENPRKTLPSALKQVLYRIVLFYIGSLTLISLLVNAQDDRLLGSSSADATASPFVIAINNAGIKGLPSVMNCVILVSVMSVGNSAVYGGSRTIAALAAQGLAPKCFNYIDRMGRPIFGILLNSAFGALAYLVASEDQNTVFAWLMAITGLSVIFTWMSILICHLRFRMAMKAQGHSLDELPFTSQAGVLGSLYGIVWLVIFLGVQFWVALFPLGSSSANAKNFFQNYLGAIIILAMYIARKLWSRKLNEFIPLAEIPLDVGRANVDIDLLAQEMAEEKAILRTKPFWFRVYKFLC
ncbi:general amino acid permease [Cyberlindnera jadinii NRRL Y-1542]|uniref:General amino acid permease n=1 Tax=Cyberlindnera jadinii (strain ATCC 18201 / CBS 1600 / BCRC 20928 / JCM 3617 / NBRC 0987 / NRRL Y-1542) TaxID=983966 RepID=A0A1E4S611_CYBJN|nr:general amino acid permease [Cyberlindnera jadinii NRRL Y-1542]ODV74954.1 general amino acid permease [Cyberlindnera jadinii NRRL Y-1542]